MRALCLAYIQMRSGTRLSQNGLFNLKEKCFFFELVKSNFWVNTIVSAEAAN